MVLLPCSPCRRMHWACRPGSCPVCAQAPHQSHHALTALPSSSSAATSSSIPTHCRRSGISNSSSRRCCSRRGSSCCRPVSSSLWGAQGQLVLRLTTSRCCSSSCTCTNSSGRSSWTNHCPGSIMGVQGTLVTSTGSSRRRGHLLLLSLGTPASPGGSRIQPQPQQPGCTGPKGGLQAGQR